MFFTKIWFVKAIQATKFGGNNQAVTPSFPYLLNKVSDPSLPCFHYFSFMFHHCSCLISVLVSRQNFVHAIAQNNIKGIYTMETREFMKLNSSQLLIAEWVDC